MTICFNTIATCAKDQTIRTSGRREIFLFIVKKARECAVLYFIIMRYRKIEIMTVARALFTDIEIHLTIQMSSLLVQKKNTFEWKRSIFRTE